MASTARRVLVSLFCVFMVASAATAGVGSVAAQDVPPLPAVYHGELTVEDGEVTEPVQIEVVADGEVQDTIRTDGSGAIGGPTISDEKLEVQEPNETEIEFHVGGTPVTIVSVNGDSVNDDSIPFASGDQEIVLEADAADVEPAVELSITNAPTTVEAGESVAVEISADNVGPVTTSQEIELTDFDQTVVDTTTADLGIGETTSTTLTWETPTDLGGNGTLTVQAGNETATHELTVERVSPPPVAQPSPGGATGGEDDEETNGTDLPTGVSATDEQDIESDDGFGLSQVRFTSVTTVESVTWDTTEVNGSVTATAYSEVPNETAPVPGSLISLSEITVPTDIRDTQATVQFTLTADQLASADATAEDLRIFRFTDGGWESLETTVISTDDNSTLIQAETPGFSYFAVSATGPPTASFSIEPDSPDTNTTITFDGSGSETPYGNITAYEWNIAGESLTGETAETTIDESGTVEVELTVENDAGETDTTTQSVTVSAVESGDGDTNSGTDTGDSGTTDDGIPGFTSVLTIVALLATLLGVRYSTGRDQ